jgi:hypothetical protein
MKIFFISVDLVKRIGHDGFELIVKIIDNFDEFQTNFTNKNYNVQWNLLPESKSDILLPFESSQTVCFVFVEQQDSKIQSTENESQLLLNINKKYKQQNLCVFLFLN